MNRQRAIKLLEMLRRRTEANGATPAEAVQAVELAERLMKRCKIAPDNVESASRETSSMELDTKVCPFWAQLLAWGIERRFKLDHTEYRRQVGKRAVISFVGPEHIASVAAWLFRALANDVMTRATRHSRRAGLSGAEMVKFRNEFCKSAALELYGRLNPPTEQQRIAAEQAEREAESRCSRREVRPLSREELLAFFEGAKAGRDISIDTNAVGGRKLSRLTHTT